MNTLITIVVGSIISLLAIVPMLIYMINSIKDNIHLDNESRKKSENPKANKLENPFELTS